ncbi:MAG: hypothetical protein ABUS48_03900 [Pseudomonadota bacterium]
MWWKLTLIWLVATVLIVGPFLPIETTVDIKMDLPPGPHGEPAAPPSPEQWKQVERVSGWIAGAIGGVWVLGVLALAIWLSRRVIAKNRARRSATPSP